MSVSTPPSLPSRYVRTRISRACVACQQKKQKCDGRTPSCNNCLKADRTCIIQDPSTKRQHPRGYLEALESHNAALENHVASLERRLKELQSSAGSDALPQNTPSDTSGFSCDSQSLNPATPSNLVSNSGHSGHNHNSNESVVGAFSEAGASSTTRDRHSTATDIDDGSNLELLCLRSAGADPHYFGASSTYSFTKIFSASLRAIRTQAPGMSMSGVADSFAQFRSKPSPVPLPDRSLTTMLTAAYFEQIHPQFPFLHRSTYLQWEEEVLKACEGGYAPDPAQAFFVYALSAVGALTGPLAGGTLPEGLFASAEELFEHVIKLNTLESIQAILCCAMYSIRSPVGVSVWLLSGLALRLCTELGLHRKMAWNKFNSNPLKAQIRKRVFWCCYNLDRAVSVTLGRPQGITDSDIDVEFPLDIDDENLTSTGMLCQPRSGTGNTTSTTMSAAIHTLRVRRIWARIQGSVYPQVCGENSSTPTSMIEGFKQELVDWLESAPAQLASNEEHNNAFGSREWFEAVYHHSILLLHRHSLVNRCERPAVCVFLTCARSGSQLCSLYRQLYVSNRLTDTWASLHNLFLGGVTFIYCLWSSAETRAHFRLDSVSDTFTACNVVLSIIAEGWSCAAPYRNAFDMLTRATMAMLVDNLATPMEPSFPVLPSAANDQFSGYVADMAEVGICISVEDLLATMMDPPVA